MKKIRQLFVRLSILIVGSYALLRVGSASAATHDILMTADGFEPAYLEIELGDTVRWINWDLDFYDVHSTRSYSYAWSSGPIPVGYYWPFTYTKTGTYDYTDDWGYSGFGLLVIKETTPPPPPGISAPFLLPNKSFECTITNLVSGKIFYVEASTNLLDWSVIYTSSASATTQTYTDNDAPLFPRRFYRVAVAP